ncbi:unnamed protein product [Thlaspi arvense]|uniref:Uncharacterized protein n=1 Tax=Thlaspi arvense TaxID=13288 RepID=A0AAU9SCQ0_THLAR|nr:unnamed protein product [Thlaspi arvense]
MRLYKATNNFKNNSKILIHINGICLLARLLLVFALNNSKILLVKHHASTSTKSQQRPSSPWLDLFFFLCSQLFFLLPPLHNPKLFPKQ